MKRLCFLEVDDSDGDHCISKMFEMVSPKKREKLKKYRCDIDRKIGVYADVLLRLMICESSGLKCRDIVIEEGKTGKPYLAGSPRLEFNISHTRNAVAAALSDKPVGVDTERIRKADISLACDIFTQNEFVYLNSDEEGRHRRFFDLWTKKEAVIKHNGDGLPGNLKTIDVMCCPPPLEISTLYFGDYVVSACSEHRFSKTDAVSITEAELLALWLKYC